MNKLDELIITRACRYGAFEDVAQRTNNIFASMLNGAPQLSSTTPLYREALHMIAMKIARLVNGQINDADSWIDIAGYATLVHNQIVANEEGKAAKSAFADEAAMKDMEEQITQNLKQEA